LPTIVVSKVKLFENRQKRRPYADKLHGPVENAAAPPSPSFDLGDAAGGFRITKPFSNIPAISPGFHRTVRSSNSPSFENEAEKAFGLNCGG
jgi:hypothetical protein